MPHITTGTMQNSLLHIFDPVEYQGVREHFSTSELERIDELRLRTPAVFSFTDRLFICWALDKVVMTADNPG